LNELCVYNSQDSLSERQKGGFPENPIAFASQLTLSLQMDERINPHIVKHPGETG
jgi:hypothetical protein